MSVTLIFTIILSIIFGLCLILLSIIILAKIEQDCCSFKLKNDNIIYIDESQVLPEINSVPEEM